jgi:hypothetical protein
MTKEQIQPFADAEGSVIITFITSKNNFHGRFLADFKLRLENRWLMVSNNNAEKYDKTKNKDLTEILDGSDFASIIFSNR